jgi:hypothetical protein
LVCAACPLFGMLTAGSSARAAVVTWFGPSQAPNSNATWTGTTSAQNYGVAFITGTAASYSMDWLTIGLNTSTTGTTGSGSLVVELRDTINTAPYTAISGTTLYATDTITFSTPTTTNTNFAVNMSSAGFPNISGFAMSGTTAYALRLWGPSRGYGIQRTTNYANGTTNDFYTVSDGFVALDTFRNNVPNYSNTLNSYPTLSISFGTTFVPEPGTCVIAIAGIVCGGWYLRRRA